MPSSLLHDTPTTKIYTLSLHDALPIYARNERKDVRCAHCGACHRAAQTRGWCGRRARVGLDGDRKSTRLNSSHLGISYAVFCLKKKKKQSNGTTTKTTETEPSGSPKAI